MLQAKEAGDKPTRFAFLAVIRSSAFRCSVRQVIGGRRGRERKICANMVYYTSRKSVRGNMGNRSMVAFGAAMCAFAAFAGAYEMGEEGD